MGAGYDEPGAQPAYPPTSPAEVEIDHAPATPQSFQPTTPEQERWISPAPPQGSNRTWWILGIVFLVLIVICCCCALLVFVAASQDSALRDDLEGTAVILGTLGSAFRQ